MCGVRDCRLREALVRWTEHLGVNKGTDWDSGLAQNIEHLAHAKIAVRGAHSSAWSRKRLGVVRKFNVVRTCKPAS